jgi:GTPase SAR1 family protein
MGDDIAEMLGGFIALTLMLGVIAMIAIMASFVVVPVGLAGAGGLYYLHNIHLPEKRRKEALARTEALYKRAQELSPSFDRLEAALFAAGIESAALHRIAKVLYDQEGLRPPVLPPVGDDQIKLARYQDVLERFINNAQPDHYETFERHLIWALSEFEPEDQDKRHMFRSERSRTKVEIERLMQRFINDDGLFEPLVNQLNKNFFDEGEVYPSKSKHDDYAWRYLKDTPLLDLAEISESVSLSDRQYHTYLLGSSGSGKTNLIENIIAHDLASDEDCCVVVIDSQTQLTDKLARLDVSDTTYITPKFELALNLFDVGYDEMKGRGIEGESLINKTVGLLSFVLEGMMGADFTNPQKTIFQYVIQLVISIPGGNINTFMEVLAEGGHERYADAIGDLDENLQRFFTVDYPSPEYKRTREAIRRRMDSLLLNPTFRRLFSATENKIDMLEEIERQKLIIIDTNKPMLDDAASAFFGRLFIAMILRASHQRFKKGRQLRPVYLIVDEAHEYFDKSVSDMLEQARKAKIGLVVAHQSISQSRGGKGGNIADPLMVNTATKLIWTSFRDDAAKFAGSMQVKPEDILNLPQFTFGMHSRKRGFTPVRGENDALGHFPIREDSAEFKTLMEEKYGPSSTEIHQEPDEQNDDELKDFMASKYGSSSEYEPRPRKKEMKEDRENEDHKTEDFNDLGEPHDVETI